MTIKLIYIGRGDAFYHVPARDLTDEDFAERAEVFAELGITEAVLIESGLYEKPHEVVVVNNYFADAKVVITDEETKAPKRGKAKKDGE